MVAELVNAVPAALQVLATCLERHHCESAPVCSRAACMRLCAQQPFAQSTAHKSIFYSATSR